MKRLLATSLLSLVFALACQTPAHAEPPRTPSAAAPKESPAPPPAAAPNAAPAASVKIAPWRARMLREEVGLDDKTAATVERILVKYRPERKAQADIVDAEQRKLNAMLELDSNDQAAYRRSIRAMLDARQRLQELQRRQADELGQVLTPKQQAKLARAIGETRAAMRQRRGRGYWHGGGRRG